jgi:salicylate hydroxylase
MILSSALFALPLVASATAAELTVAIYGGGVASATLAQALKGYDHINLQYYDPALNLTPTSFRLLGLSPKAWDALDLVGDEAGGAINRATWYPEDPSIVIVVCRLFHLYPKISPLTCISGSR